MSPILGIWASQNYTRVILPTSFDSIATTTVGAGGTASISFTSIPSTYTHLQLRMYVVNSDYGNLKINNDATASNYYSHSLGGNGSTVGANAYSSAAYIPWRSSTSTAPYVEICDILDYANTNKNKTLRSLAGWDNNGSGNVYLNSVLWQSTAAINRLDLTPATGNFAQYSHFALYGIKGA